MNKETIRKLVCVKFK